MKQIILLSSTLFICLFGYAQTNVISFYFDVNLSVPNLSSQEQLILFKEKVVKKECVIEKVYAYTDSIGSAKHNETLAKKRLQFVTHQLEIQDSSTIPQLALALNRVYDNQTFLNWRRVDIYYQEIPPITIEPVVPDTIQFIPVEQEQAISDTTAIEHVPYFNTSSPQILNVEFIEGTAKLYEKSLKEIRKLADFLIKNETTSILIRGHVCCDKNMHMSKKRAKRVYNELIQLGIPKSRLDYIGMSNKEPLVTPELTDSDRQRNRRVDVKFKEL